MKTIYKKQFLKDIEALPKSVGLQLKEILLEINQSSGIHEIRNLIKMKGFESYYRIRIGDYRIGLELVDMTNIKFYRILHRKEIYRKFPN